MSQILEAEFRGTARTCPTCNGVKLVNSPFATIRDTICDTCLGHGIVHPGVYCEECGRSVQYEYRGHLVCGLDICQASIDEKIKNGKYTTLQAWEQYGYGNEWTGMI